MYSGSEPQTRQPKRSVQGGTTPGRIGLGCLAVLLALTGCASVPSEINPVGWWHDLQGGKIAEQRPPPPGASDPYPNLASVPERPAPLDPNIRAMIHQSLLADRISAQQAAVETPLPALAKTQEAAPAAAANPAGAGASLAAASAPPAPAAVPPPAVPLPREMPQGSSAQMGALPPLPAAPPPPANLPGARPSAVSTAAKTPAPPAGMVLPPGSIPVPFAAGASALAPDGSAVLHAAAVKRGKAGIVVTGFGEASSSDPAIQANALTLALLRAQAIARALAAEGVPAAAVVTDAQAEGRGAAVRLVN